MSYGLMLNHFDRGPPQKVDAVQCIVCLRPIGACDAWRLLTSVALFGAEPRSYAKKYDF